MTHQLHTDESRRHFIKMFGATALMAPPFSLAHLPKQSGRKKLIWLLLRGGLDSLHTLIPYQDKQLLHYRQSLASPVVQSPLIANEQFAFHPKLPFLHHLYQQRQLAPIVAVATPSKSRSHFEAQDVIESGIRPANVESGWLARAVEQQYTRSLSMCHSQPVSTRGYQHCYAWLPQQQQAQSPSLNTQLAAMYSGHQTLTDKLTNGIALQSDLREVAISGNKFKQISDYANAFLFGEFGIDAIMLEDDGWDTHNNQASKLGKKLNQLNTLIKHLHQALGKNWDDTLIIVGTEFGRTVRENGTQGTDHGTASCMFMLGGSVNGGQVLGDWPGLTEDALFQSRDLAPTSSSLAWIATALKQHWHMSDKQLAKVLPNQVTYNTPLFNPKKAKQAG